MNETRTINNFFTKFRSIIVNNARNIILLSLVIFSLTSCGGGWEEFEGALTGKKKSSTDEYLIKKKD